MPRVATIDFHVTSECSQECPYCWGPQDVEAVNTETAKAIISKIAATEATRIVFTGGDPLQRDDIGDLVRHARGEGLEVAVSTTGDELKPGFLAAHGSEIDLISLPLDGASEEVSVRTKQEGHFAAVMLALVMLAEFPEIDIKVATPVTKHNIHDLPNIVGLLDERAASMPNRFFYNVFQAFPRSMSDDVAWDELVVSTEEFAAVREQVEASEHAFRINWLSHETLDKLYVMIFPDGMLTVPVGPSFRFYGSFLDIDDLDAVLEQAEFDAAKHLRHSEGWSKGDG
jgi:MoaA/NifB/PqqE/SkfB family radical SAM enzyme